jgi:hypothetical protein
MKRVDAGPGWAHAFVKRVLERGTGGDDGDREVGELDFYVWGRQVGSSGKI